MGHITCHLLVLNDHVDLARTWSLYKLIEHKVAELSKVMFIHKPPLDVQKQREYLKQHKNVQQRTHQLSVPLIYSTPTGITRLYVMHYI